MHELAQDDKHEALIDDENVEWIADIPSRAYPYVQQLRMEAIAFDNPIKERLADMIMRTSGTREGRHSDRVLEAVKQQPEQEVDHDTLMHMPTLQPAKDEGSDGKKGSKGLGLRSSD